jgi:DNA invertase Pin-like site-specific DNA recombinase
MPTYRKAKTEQVDPYKAQELPFGRPIAVYYRQSTEGQIGNISTTLQTVDMVEHLIRQGWQREQIIMIDSDAGVSGTKKIREREGLSEVYDLIEGGKIGVVAAQDVDRFFRDMAQIETNIFIDACRRNNVLVLTPTFIYDFAHPTQGRYHMQLFREQVQRAADFLEYHIKGRLLPARHRQMKSGQWGGSVTLLGYMVDTRSVLLNGEPNPDYHRYPDC